MRHKFDFSATFWQKIPLDVRSYTLFNNVVSFRFTSFQVIINKSPDKKIFQNAHDQHRGKTLYGSICFSLYLREFSKSMHTELADMMPKWVKFSQKRPNPTTFSVLDLSHLGKIWPTKGRSVTGSSDMTPKLVRLALNGTNPGLFQIRFQYILAPRAKMYWNLIWKSLGFVPFWVNLNHFGAKPTISESGSPLGEQALHQLFHILDWFVNNMTCYVCECP